MHGIWRLFFILLLIASAFLLVEESFAAPHQLPRPQVKPAKNHTVSYLPDGTPIATGRPRRLSPLAGTDSIAWSYARSGRAKHGKRPSQSKMGKG